MRRRTRNSEDSHWKTVLSHGPRWWKKSSISLTHCIHWFMDSMTHWFIDSMIHWFIISLIHYSLVDSMIQWSSVLWLLDFTGHWLIQSAVRGFFHVISLASQPPFAHSLMHFPWNLTISGSMRYHMVHIITQHIPTVLSNNTCNLTCDLHQRTGLWYGTVALLVSVLHSPVATEK